MTTGQRIKAARKAAGLTQKELGKKLGVAYQTFAQWENDLRNPKMETLERIADALDISVDYLLKGTIAINSAYIGPGVAIYRNTSPYGIDLSALKDIPEDSYDIKYQDKHTIITVDKDSPLSEIEQTDLVNEIMLAYNLHSSATVEESLTDEESAIKILLNEIGYDIIKQHGDFVFSYGHGFSVISDSDFNDLLSCAQNGLKVAAKTLELKLLREALGPLYPDEIVWPPSASQQPPEGTDTTPPENAPEKPPEGE